MDMTEQGVSELEDRLIEIIQDEEERLKKKLTEPYGPIRYQGGNIHILEMRQEKRVSRCKKIYLK